MRMVTLVIVVSASLLAACGPDSVSERRDLDELHSRVADADLPAKMQLELTVVDGDIPAVRTLLIDHLSPAHFPVTELRYLRIDREDGSELGWPEGWELVGGSQAYGSHTNGMQPGVRYRDRLHVVRTGRDSPPQLTLRQWCPADGTYDPERLAESDWVTLQFDGVAHPLAETDFAEVAPLLFTVSRYEAGDTPRTFAIRFDGTWESAQAHGRLDEPSRAGFRGVLEKAAVWRLLDGEDAELSADPNAPPIFRVAVVHGDGFRQRTIEGYDFLEDPGWISIRQEIERLTGEDVLR